MPSKNPAAPRKRAARPAKPAPSATTGNSAPVPARYVWTLPIAMLMLIVAAGGLWLAVRESSNTPQAAAASPAHSAVAPVPASTPASRSAAPAVNAGAGADTKAALPAASKPVSVTGCLQHAGDGFVLKNAEGPAVSKTRSWKSGFLKHSAPSIDLLDGGHAVPFGAHVGQRVSVSGPLADGAMHVQALRRVAATCQ